LQVFENESHEGVKLIKIRPKRGTVKLDVGGTNPIVTLTMDGWAESHPNGKGFSGFLDRLSGALADTPRETVLCRANTDLVLFLYSQFTGRTLIRSPRLPAASFDLDFRSARPEGAANQIHKALRAKGITTIEDGDKFIMVVPTSEKATAKPLSSGIKALSCESRQPELFPQGAFINFPDTELIKVIKFYGDLTGCELDGMEKLAALNGTVNFMTQTPLTTEECVYALETLLNWQGVKVVPAGEHQTKIEYENALY